MKMQFRLPGGDLEYAVLAKLWELGSASAREIHEQVGEPAKLVYTTTAKVLDRLHAKRLVRANAGVGLLCIVRMSLARLSKEREPVTS